MLQTLWTTQGFCARGDKIKIALQEAWSHRAAQTGSIKGEDGHSIPHSQSLTSQWVFSRNMLSEQLGSSEMGEGLRFGGCRLVSTPTADCNHLPGIADSASNKQILLEFYFWPAKRWSIPLWNVPSLGQDETIKVSGEENYMQDPTGRRANKLRRRGTQKGGSDSHEIWENMYSARCSGRMGWLLFKCVTWFRHPSEAACPRVSLPDWENVRPLTFDCST